MTRTEAPRPSPTQLTDLSPADVAGGVVPRFHSVVSARPQAVAASDDRRRVSYGSLAYTAGVVRTAVRAQPGRGAVALLAGHDVGALGALLGVVASGRPLVVLDPRSPADLLRRLAARARAGVCVTDAAHAALASSVAPHVVVADRAGVAVEGLDQLWSAAPDASSTAVLAFTSGTTGRPKVVVNSHRMLVRDAWANTLGTGCYGPHDVVVHSLPIAFHAGLTAALSGVLTGARQVFHDLHAGAVATLAPKVAEVGATVVHLSPSRLRALVAASPDPAQLATLRTVTVTGEPLYAADLSDLWALLPPGCTVRHRYGSSETGLVSEQVISAADAPADGLLPAGTAVGGLSVSLVEPGVVAVTGADLSGGYWDDADATAAAFTTHPDGTTTYLTGDVGRLDPAGRLLVVGRTAHTAALGADGAGGRVEPGDVDEALFALPDVAEAATVARDGQLVAFVVLRDATRDTGTEGVRAAVAATLPAPLVPARVVRLDALPRTARGKIDRASLPG